MQIVILIFLTPEDNDLPIEQQSDGYDSWLRVVDLWN